LYPNINSYRLPVFQTPRIGGHDDFPHLSSFNACEELDHLIILYPPVPRTHKYWEGHCPPKYYGGAALVSRPLKGQNFANFGT